jgi:hypothetical protein
MFVKAAIALVCAGSLALGLQDTTKPQDRTAKVPGVTAKDPFPQGCVSCHVKLPDGRDVRLNNAIKLVKGHPDIAKIVAVVPTDCKKCHFAGGEKGLEKILHKMHYGKQEKSIYVQEFGEGCLNCHTVALKTGKMTVKSAPKNW